MSVATGVVVICQKCKKSPATTWLPVQIDQEASDLLAKIEGHQYGLRGFGDGSLSRGRDFTDRECRTILRALKLAANTPAAQEKT